MHIPRADRFGETLDHIIRRAGDSRHQAAAKTGFTFYQIRAWALGMSVPMSDITDQIFSAYPDIDREELISALLESQEAHKRNKKSRFIK